MNDASEKWANISQHAPTVDLDVFAFSRPMTRFIASNGKIRSDNIPTHSVERWIIHLSTWLPDSYLTIQCFFRCISTIKQSIIAVGKQSFLAFSHFTSFYRRFCLQSLTYVYRNNSLHRLPFSVLLFHLDVYIHSNEIVNSYETLWLVCWIFVHVYYHLHRTLSHMHMVDLSPNAAEYLSP